MRIYFICDIFRQVSSSCSNKKMWRAERCEQVAVPFYITNNLSLSHSHSHSLSLSLSLSRAKICMYIHIYSCIHKYSYTHKCIRTCMHTYKHICMHGYKCILVYMHAHMYIHINTFTYVYTCIHTYISLSSLCKCNSKMTFLFDACYIFYL